MKKAYAIVFFIINTILFVVTWAIPFFIFLFLLLIYTLFGGTDTGNKIENIFEVANGLFNLVLPNINIIFTIIIMITTLLLFAISIYLLLKNTKEVN